MHQTRTWTFFIYITERTLKRQSNKIFYLQFFHHLNLPGPLTNGLKYFRFWLRIRWVINFERKRRKELSVDIRIRVIASNPADQLGSLRIQIHNTADNKTKNKPTRQHNARKPMPTMRQGSIFYILTPPPGREKLLTKALGEKNDCVNRKMRGKIKWKN